MFIDMSYMHYTILCFVSFTIVVLATQIQIFYGTHPEMIEDLV